MTRHSSDLTGMLRWYPPAWRERYGDEMTALMEDQLAGRRPDVRLRLSTAWNGLRERAHDSGLVGNGAAPERLRAGSLLVLFSWSAFMLAGASFAKITEHFAAAMPIASRAVAQQSFDVAVVLGVAGIAIVLVAGVVALPTFIRLLQGGGWIRMRRPVQRGAQLSAVLVVATVGLGLWAHHISALQRNGSNGAYSAAFLFWGLLVAAALAQWTLVVARGARLGQWRVSTLRVEAAFATSLALIMAGITAAAAVWWTSVGAHAPWFLQGSRGGVAVSAFTPNIVATMVLMAVAGATGLVGVIGITRSWGARLT